MKLKVGITRELFDEQDLLTFYDSKTVFFDPTVKLPSEIKFKIWGAGIMPGFEWEKHLDLNKHPKLKDIIDRTGGHEITIKGFGEFSLDKVVAGKIKIYPYDTSGKQINFMKDSNGES